MHDDCLSRKNIWKETTKYKPREQYRAISFSWIELYLFLTEKYPCAIKA